MQIRICLCVFSVLYFTRPQMPGRSVLRVRRGYRFERGLMYFAFYTNLPVRYDGRIPLIRHGKNLYIDRRKQNKFFVFCFGYLLNHFNEIRLKLDF